jgi:MFS family permease
MNEPVSAPHQARIGPIRLSPGVSAREVFIFLFVTGIAVVFTAFINLMQPYVFREMLHVPAHEQGRLAGQLMTVQQFVFLIFVGVAGSLADRVGRKAMLVFALLGFSLSAALYPLASGIMALFLIRVLFGLASTGHTAGGPTKFFDYPDNASRGKFMALVMVFNALLSIVLIGGIGSRLPGWLRSSGLSIADAGARALWISAALGVLTALVAMFFMMRDRPTAEQRATQAAGRGGVRQMFAGFGEVLAYAKVNRGFGMLLVTCFVIRSDTAVIGSFMALWVTTDGAKHGVSTVEAIKIAGQLAAIISAMSLVMPPILGVLLDRVSRQTIYIVSVAAVGVVFLCAPLVHDVTTWTIYALAVFIGLAESAQTISQQAFFGEQAPAHLRGTAYGLLAFFGTASVVVISAIAGYLFDLMGPTAPFILTGALHAASALVAVAILARRAGALRTSVAA